MRRGLLLAALLALPGRAGAELALLDSGRVLKVDSVQRAGERVVLTLAGGGEVTLAAGQLVEVRPDEIRRDAPAVAAPAPVAVSSASELERMAIAAAERYGLEPSLVLAVIAVESAFQPQAVSHRGAQGLMQLMPATAAELGVADAFDPAANLDGGTRHLRDLLQRYSGDLSRALAAYNAGVASVERHGGVPPFPETQRYVAAVLRRYAAP